MNEPATHDRRFRRSVRQLLAAVERSVAANRELEQAHAAFVSAAAAPELRLALADTALPADADERGRDGS